MSLITVETFMYKAIFFPILKQEAFASIQFCCYDFISRSLLDYLPCVRNENWVSGNLSSGVFSLTFLIAILDEISTSFVKILLEFLYIEAQNIAKSQAHSKMPLILIYILFDIHQCIG